MGTLTHTFAQVQDAIDQQYDGDQAVDTGWTDMRFPAERTKKITGKEPKETAYKGGQILEFEDDKTQAIAFNGQTDHGYKVGTDLEAHIHVCLPVAGSGSGVENIKFDLTYSWFEIGATIPSETTLTTTVDIQDWAADEHILVELGNLPIANMAVGDSRVSSMIICSFQRDHTVANNTSKHVYLLEADFHYEVDQERGSRTEYTK